MWGDSKSRSWWDDYDGSEKEDWQDAEPLEPYNSWAHKKNNNYECSEEEFNEF